MSRFTFLTLILLLSSALSSDATRVIQQKHKHKMYHRICHSSRSPPFCYNLLSQKPHADLVTLAQFTIDITRANVSNTVKLINTLLLQTGNKDPEAHNYYYRCMSHFGVDGALSHVDNAEEMLKGKDYTYLNSAASSVFSDISYCLEGESPSDTPFNDPSILPQYANEVWQVVDIILIISNLLKANNPQ